jgi:MscS family membrane protein
VSLPRCAAILVLAIWFATLGVAHAREPAIDRSTPQQTVAGFLRAAEEEDTKTAARYLELDGRRSSKQTQEIVQQLAEVLRWRVWIDPTSLSDVPEGDSSDGVEIERIASVEVDGERVPVTLTHTQRDDSEVWLFSAVTLGRLPEMAAPEGASSWISRLVPEAWRATRIVGLWSWQ